MAFKYGNYKENSSGPYRDRIFPKWFLKGPVLIRVVLIVTEDCINYKYNNKNTIVPHYVSTLIQVFMTVKGRNVYTHENPEEQPFMISYSNNTWHIGLHDAGDNGMVSPWTLKQHTQQVCPSSVSGDWVFTDESGVNSVLNFDLGNADDACVGNECPAGESCYALPSSIFTECVKSTNACEAVPR